MIRIKSNADPFSAQADPDTNLDSVRIEPILADSLAGQLFRQELRRYCNGEIKGRSFLVAGHRGSGKTTMVDYGLLEYKRYRLPTPDSEHILMKPLPIYLLGPTLLESNADDKDTHPATPATNHPQTMTVAVNVAGESISQSNVQKSRDDDLFMHHVLIQVVMGLHQALSKEFIARFYFHANRIANSNRKSNSYKKEAHRLAAQFEIELPEAPSPSRLFEFWHRIDALQYGILFDQEVSTEAPDLLQGMHELVALCGVVHAHQRISGDLKETDDQRTGRSKVSETTAGLEIGNMAILKPLTAVASGAAVATAATVSGNPWAALPLGLFTALGTSLFIRMSSVTQFRRERKIDRTFIPDFSIKTLHRLIPTLIDRLKAAHLAPVFIVDELDKVDNLDVQLAPLLKNLKKLATESSFTCLLVDRGYYENLHINEEREQDRSAAVNPDPSDEGVRKSAFGRNFSYYSHRILVAFRPVDLHLYLTKLLELKDGPITDQTSTSRQLKNESDNLDRELIRWVLLHRSQLNALALNRLIEAWRGKNSELLIPSGGAIRTDEAYRIDLTLQFAIELELADPKIAPWLDRRPRLYQALIDAAYYVSREWLEQDRTSSRDNEGYVRRDRLLDLTKAGLPAFRAYLLHRMNLHADDSPTKDKVLIKERNQERSKFDRFALRDEEVETLYEVAIGIARSLAYSTDSESLKRKWISCAEKARLESMSKPSQELYDALLFGPEKSVLVSTSGSDTTCLQFLWRYLPSGNESQTTSLQIIHGEAQGPIESISNAENLLNTIFGISTSASTTDVPIFLMLADHYRILPTTPAWTHVESARNNIAQAGQGQGNKISLKADLSVVKEFASLVTDARAIKAVTRVLISGAYLGKTDSQSMRGQALHSGVRILAEALQFKDCPLTEVLARLESFKNELQVLTGYSADFFDNESAEVTRWPPEKSFTQTIESALGAGLVDRAKPQEPIVQQAWESATRRLQAFAHADKPQIADTSEIVCAARGIGPGKVLDLNLSRMTPRRWTSTLIDALTTTPSPPPGWVKSPLWLAAYALDRLGMGGIGTDSQNVLIGSLEQAQTGRDFTELRSHIEMARLWRGEGGRQRVAIVICGEKTSMTDNWTTVSNLGLILVVPASAVAKLVGLFIYQWLNLAAKSLNTNPGPVILAWEPLAATDRDEKAIRDEIKKNFSSISISDVWLYRHGALGGRTPQIVGATSAEEFWIKLEAAQRTAAPK